MRSGTDSLVSRHDVALATAYTRRLDLPLLAPDALHISIARRLEATLVTFDRGMAAAAGALGVAVTIP
jgi:predicted nucleic acid-binding protein